MTILSADNVSYAFPGGIPALSNLSLSVEKGRRLAVLGPNGAGKTTLFLHLNGTLKPNAGRVTVAGKPGDYTRRGLNDWRRRVGLVMQDADDQLFAATVFEDVSFGPLNLGLSEAEARERVEEALAALRITDLKDRPTHRLSGGQKKRVAIAGAIAMRPEVLLLDEPTAGLDHPGSAHLVALLERLSAGGMTLVFSTHEVDLALRLADEVALFSSGSVIAHGPAEAVLADKDLLAAAHLRPPLLVEVCLKARELGLLGSGTPLPRDPSQLLQLMDRWVKERASAS